MVSFVINKRFDFFKLLLLLLLLLLYVISFFFLVTKLSHSTESFLIVG